MVCQGTQCRHAGGSFLVVQPGRMVAADAVLVTDGATDFGDDITGDRGANHLRGLDGTDVLRGHNGNDRIWGNTGADELRGGRGDDRIWGGDGADTIYGREDDDLLWGGRGADTFVFMRGDDEDRIMDFQNNVDTLVLDGWGRGALSNAYTKNGNVVIEFNSGEELTILDISLAQLADDIVFA